MGKVFEEITQPNGKITRTTLVDLCSDTIKEFIMQK
jgi:hypothetical protein